MSVTVRHLNADSTFLLIFSPEEKPSANHLHSVNGAFSVLLDPWLVGSSVINASWFARTERLVPSAIRHLSEIEEPDVVLISQNQPDHCHKETLLQLRPEAKSLIAAEPGAAKVIKSWNHFDPHRVRALVKYDARERFGNTLRLPIPPLGPNGLSGELNIAFIPAKNYVTGLHNAFGITYQAPTRTKALASVATIDLPRKTLSMTFTPSSLPAESPLPMSSSVVAEPTTSPLPQQPFQSCSRTMIEHESLDYLREHKPLLPHSYDKQCPESLSLNDQLRLHQSTPETHHNSTTIPPLDYDAGTPPGTTDFLNTPITPPLSPTTSSATAFHRKSDLSDTLPPPPSSTNTSITYSLPYSPSLIDLQSRYSRPPTTHPARPKALSILYSPHGLPLADLKPYIKTHLVPLPGALPLTCLLHSFDNVSNPWWFGGNIIAGAKTGTEIARALMARTWISAHDEEKDDHGLAVKFLKHEKTSPDVVRRNVDQGIGNGCWGCDVRVLDVGGEVCLCSTNAVAGSVRGKSLDVNDRVGLGLQI